MSKNSAPTFRALPKRPKGVDVSFDVRQERSTKAPAPILILAFAKDVVGFACKGIAWPVTTQRKGNVIRVELGEVRAVEPRGLQPVGDFCDEGRNQGPSEVSTLAALPSNLSGTHTLEVKHNGVTDRYNLEVSARRIEIKPVSATFSWTPPPGAWSRLPEGAIHLRCFANADASTCRARADAGALTCEKFFADPKIASLPPIELGTSPHVLAVFDEKAGCNARSTDDLPALKKYIEAINTDPFHCAQVQVHTWRNEVFWSPLGPRAVSLDPIKLHD